MTDPQSDDLAKKLQAWSVRASVPASFEREVWQRIASRQRANHDFALGRFLHTLLSLAARPQYALAIILASVSISLGVARTEAQATKARQWKALEERYAASIDPLAMAR